MRLITPIFLVFFLGASGQEQNQSIYLPQLSFYLGQVLHFSKTNALNNKTFSPTANSTYLELSFNTTIMNRHQLFSTLMSSNYKFKYVGNYIHNNNEQVFTSSRTGFRSGYQKLSLLHGYLLINQPKIKVYSLIGPNFNYLGKTGLWGKSQSEIIDSSFILTNKTIIQDSIIKSRRFGIGICTGINALFKFSYSKNLYLNLKLLYNYGFNNLYEIHTKTITNGNLYDESKIRGKGSGFFFCTGITFNLKK